jgi:pimeloyl-ACP methyl ester carboxylesterase
MGVISCKFSVRAMCAGGGSCQGAQAFQAVRGEVFGSFQLCKVPSAWQKRETVETGTLHLSQPSFLETGGERIAYLKRNGSGPGLVWLGGWRSDMQGSKAAHLDGLAERQEFPLLRFDYSGHGQSSGHWSDGTISKWVAESMAVLRHAAPDTCVLVGSSMGAWVTLRLLAELQKAGEADRIKGLVLIAPAPDFAMELIEPKLTDKERSDLETQGWFEEPSDYLAEPNRWSKAFLDDGRANRVLTGIIDTHCPAHIIQGMKDEDVPHTHALKLVSQLPSDRVTLTLVPYGDHRLSRPEDLALLERTVLDMMAEYRA